MPLPPNRLIALLATVAWSVTACGGGPREPVHTPTTVGKGARSVVYLTQTPGDWPLFAARAIIDVDRDGTPEVIYHFNEHEDGKGHEVVLRSADAGATWAEVGNNADTCP